MPSVGDIIFILLLQLIFVFIPNFVYGDGSTGWHLVTGHYVLDKMQIPHQDLISYTFPDKPWVAYEWLFDAFIAGLDKIAGLKLVAVACCSAIAWLFLMIYDDCRRRGCHFIPALIICVMGALISAIHWLVRPHLVTFYGVFIFTKYLRDFYEDKVSTKKLLMVLGITMLIWVNCHPAFLMGLVITGIYLASDLFVWLCTAAGQVKEKCTGRIKSLALCLLVVGLVTFINPYGVQLYKYIVEYLHQTAVLAQTDEFGSPSFHGELQSVLLELLYFLLALGLVCTQKKPSLPQFLTALAYAHLSLAGKRSMPLFVIVSLPFIAELLANSKLSVFVPENTPAASWLSKVKKIWTDLGATMDSTEFICTRHALPAVAVAALAISCFNDGKALGTQLVRSDFDPKNKPTATLECLKNEKLDPNKGFTFDNWGGYIRYKTGMRVFIDDRVDFYGQNFYLDYANISTLQPDWRDRLAKYKIDWILFPNNSLLAANLKNEPGWKLICEDKASYLFKRTTP
jgi:hypothetical protein